MSDHHDFARQRYGEDQDPGTNPDELQLITIGVDIGSSTSHLMVARLTLRRMGKSLASRWVVAERETLFRSPVLLTPYRDDGLIDAERLGSFVRDTLARSGFSRESVDTGVVVLTGEAMRRRNARAIADLFASRTGRFVCASAGHRLEAVVAAHGAGAVARSLQDHAVVLNVDIGGGTTKFAVVEGGRVVATAALNVGGRLLAYDADRRLIRVEPAARIIAAAEGIALEVRQPLAVEAEIRMAERMADCLAEAAAGGSYTDLTESLMLTENLPADWPLTAVTLSGGVSEYLSDARPPGFGDLAQSLAPAALSRLSGALGVPVELAPERLRATVVGLSQFTVQVSGDTIELPQAQVLPLRNLAVVRVEIADVPVAADVSAVVEQSVRVRGMGTGEAQVALALNWSGRPTYQALHELAVGVVRAAEPMLKAGHALVVSISQDCALNLGRELRRLSGSDRVVCIDGLELADFDYIDVGSRVPDRSVVPVVIKTLLFPRGSGNHGARAGPVDALAPSGPCPESPPVFSVLRGEGSS